MYDLEEQEKIDALKDWWKQNGRSVIAGVVVFVLALGGGQGYRYWKQKQREQAAVLYDAVVAGAKQKKLKDALDAARSIEETFPSSGFAARAALVAAKAAFEGGDRVGARAQLEWASDHADEVPIRNIARLRLAGVLADDRKYDEALTRLSSVDDSRFSALAADLRATFEPLENLRRCYSSCFRDNERERHANDSSFRRGQLRRGHRRRVGHRSGGGDASGVAGPECRPRRLGAGAARQGR